MVAKGHDFQRVTLVGVVSADAQLGFPDFRAAERTFQLLTQVAGRAGRGALAGEVLVETYYPEHYAIQFAAQQDYPSFFEKELHFRRLHALSAVHARWRACWCATPSWNRPSAGRGRSARCWSRWNRAASRCWARRRRRWRVSSANIASNFCSNRRGAPRSIALLAACLAFCAEKGIPDRAVLLDVDPVSLL